jgi:hypothetical protein
MIVEQVREKVAAIKSAPRDLEVHEYMTIELYEQVLQAIASGHPTPAALAEAALKV